MFKDHTKDNNVILEATKLPRDFAVHPGVLLKGLIEKYGVEPTSFAPRLGLSFSELDDVFNARRSFTEEQALLIEVVFGIKAELLMELQVKYNIRKAQENDVFMKNLTKVRNWQDFVGLK